VRSEAGPEPAPNNENKKIMKTERILLLAFTLFVISLRPAAGQEFINYRGPTGNGTYPGVGLLKEWPKEGPPRLWTFAPGPGWAAPALVDGKVYVVGGMTGKLWVLDLDGQLLDQHHVGGMEWKRFPGSRGVPIVKDGMAVVNAPNANYWGIDLEARATRWQVNAWKSFGNGKGSMGWGVPESPMLIDNKVLFNTCSKTNQQPAIVALDIQTGKTVWGMKTTKKYSAADVSGSWGIHNGRKLYFCPTFMYFVCLDAETGQLLWEIPSEGSKAFVPIYADGRLLWGDAKNGLHMLQLSPDGSSYSELWARAKEQAGITQGAVVGNKVFTYGVPGVKPVRGAGQPPKDGAAATETNATETASNSAQQLLCLDADTGELIQAGAALGGGALMGGGNAGTIIAADGMVYFTDRLDDTRLRVTLIEPTAKGFAAKGSFVVTDKPFDKDERWVCPAILDGRLFIRWGKLHVYDLRADPPTAGARLDGTGVFGAATPPIRWSLTRNLAFKQSLPTAAGSAPVVAGDKILLTIAPNTLACLNAADGATLWSRPHAARDVGLSFQDAAPDPSAAFPEPVVRQTNVYAAFPNGVVTACDLAGKRVWVTRLEPSAPLGAPVPFRDLLLVPGQELTALDIATGKTVWTHRPSRPVTGLAAVYVAGDTAVLTDQGALLRLNDGHAIAADVLGLGGPFRLTADVQAGRVYAAAAGNRANVVRAVALPGKPGEKCRTLWSVEPKGAAIGAAPVLYRGRLYLVGTDRQLVVLDAQTGAETGRLALDADGSSDPATVPHLAVAGHRLYVGNVGRDHRTLVVQPGTPPAVLWQYAAVAPTTAPGFAADKHVVRAGPVLWGVHGKTPAEPRPLEVPTVEPQPALAAPGRNAPVGPLQSGLVSTNWLFAGPCQPSALATNFLESLGPIARVAPTEGLAVKSGDQALTFRAATTNDFWSHDRHSGGLLALDWTAMAARKPATMYAYTVIENDQDRYVQYEPLLPGQEWRDFEGTLAVRSWLSGTPVDKGSVVLLKKGRHGLLIHAAVGAPPNSWGRIFMTPHLVDVDAATRTCLQQHAAQSASWLEYVKTKDQLVIVK
jgi:outer membrane protein assembly factor BamB